MANKILINSTPIPNLPWEDKPEGYIDPVWRYSKNPIIPRNVIPCANNVMNSAAVPFNGKFAGVFRVDNKEGALGLHRGFSEDGINWDIDPTPLSLIHANGEKVLVKGYDPRVLKIEDTYYICYCNCVDGPTVALAYTKDFVDFYDIGNSFLPFNRNGVLFPRKINGKYAILSRPSDNGHTPFGDIYYSESPDLEHWGHHKRVMATTSGWQELKIGAGPVPIETEEGWLLIYHGVVLSCNGYIYKAGVALLDKDEPWKVKYRAKPFILAPNELYEQVGDVPNVVFPCAALCDGETGRIAIYYGCADTVVGMAFTTVDELLDFVKKNS